MIDARVDGWRDPLYRPLSGLPERADVVELGGVRVGVVVDDTDPSTAPAQWMADREIMLVLPDEVTPDELRRVLPSFLEHATALADRPTAAAAVLASRDVDRARVVRSAGLTPSSILAVHDLRRTPELGADPAPGITVRDAGPDDADAVAALWCEQADYEARVGALRVSAAIRAAITAAVPGHIDGPGSVLLAELDGSVVGVVVAQSVEGSAWSGSRLAIGPFSYLALACTTDAARGKGAGASLVAELHRRHRAAGLAASTLHYSANNPLSVPFWSQQGYRPLLTYYTVQVR